MMSDAFTCNRCNKFFTRTDNLKRHEKQCIDGTQIECAYCTSTFTRDDSLKRHLNRTHSEQPFKKYSSLEKSNLPQSRQEDGNPCANILTKQLREYVLQGYGIKSPECLAIINTLRVMNVIE